jgi:hypothetical protein
MGFEYLGIVERRIHKLNNYYHLVNKYFEGKTLEERTRLDYDDFLEKCEGQAVMELSGIKYCGVMSKKIECKYQCAQNSTGLRPCSRFYLNGISYFITLEKQVHTNLSLKEIESLIDKTSSNCLEVTLNEDKNNKEEYENIKVINYIN